MFRRVGGAFLSSNDIRMRSQKSVSGYKHYNLTNLLFTGVYVNKFGTTLCTHLKLKKKKITYCGE